ncbi:Rho termination factor N-terminal domain-containing protein [Microcoleus sp. FACHB-1515]|uniref:Rho termination factor N-terminal domain-containing protein n=1 Tax=Cyanophyceae TaxID=3028117 RepID=UPI0016894E7F|nr:Rho termination factor N-terminal domain-containing protein [Microcoleus sp. FACHB-1515]MBD2088399.1 Rho termination factor N-terminal domain-containing protein [Microcoleus sp. FACHB-1515]
MSSLSSIGKLMHLYLDEIEPGEETDAPEFLIQASAHLLNQKGGRNWIPVIVKETGEDQYEVIGNSFIYAIAEEAGLDRVWCIVADDSEDTAEITKVLAGEQTPKINLSKASRDEIMAALQFLIEQPGSPLKSVRLAVATSRIDEAPRQYWKNLEPITTLKCGITKGKKLDALKQVFYLTPQPMSETITDTAILKTLSTTDLKNMAKQRGISGISKMKKNDFVEALSKPSK